VRMIVSAFTDIRGVANLAKKHKQRKLRQTAFTGLVILSRRAVGLWGMVLCERGYASS